MSYSLDANILLYASDASSPQHATAKTFLARRQGAPDILCLTWLTLMSYIRISTHDRIFQNPLPPESAWKNVRNLLALPRVRLIGESDGFTDAYGQVTGSQVVRGNLVPDAQLATILYQHGVTTLYTADRDFCKFPNLKVVDPFQST